MHAFEAYLEARFQVDMSALSAEGRYTSKFLDWKILHDRFPIPGLNVSGIELQIFFFISPLIT